ncbi:MAG: hypothetical protein ACP5ID_04955, partial [Conexivisphaera sp.]
MKVLVSLRSLEVQLAGRAIVSPGAREGEVLVQVPGEWPVLNYYLEGAAAGDRVELRSAYREDAYGTYEVSMHAVIGW